MRWCDAPVELHARGWSLRVLPTSGMSGEGGNQGENDAALVVLAGLAGQRVLVPGDAEGEVLTHLDLPPCAVVELPHHGSRGGIDAALLEHLAPRLAVVSVGPNRYGHPTPEMLALVRTQGVPCVRTDQRGDVVLTASPTGLTVAVEHDAQ